MTKPITREKRAHKTTAYPKILRMMRRLGKATAGIEMRKAAKMKIALRPAVFNGMLFSKRFSATNETVWVVSCEARVIKTTPRIRAPKQAKRKSKARKTRRILFAMTATSMICSRVYCSRVLGKRMVAFCSKG